MKFQDPNNGQVLDGIEEARARFCRKRYSCDKCPINFPSVGCVFYCEKNPSKAAAMMGYEVVYGEHDEYCTRCKHEEGTMACVDCHIVNGKRSNYEKMVDEDNDFAYNDKVNHPKHYTQGEVECIDAIKSATIGLHGIEAYCERNQVPVPMEKEERKRRFG